MVGLRGSARATLCQAIARVGAFKVFSRPNSWWAHHEGTSYKLRRGVKRALIQGGHMIGYSALLPPRHAGGTDRHAESRLPGRRHTDDHCPGSLAQDVRYLDAGTRQPLRFEQAGPANRCH